MLGIAGSHKQNAAASLCSSLLLTSLLQYMLFMAAAPLGIAMYNGMGLSMVCSRCLVQCQVIPSAPPPSYPSPPLPPPLTCKSTGMGTNTGTDMDMGISVSTNCFDALCTAHLTSAQMRLQREKHAGMWSRVCHAPQRIVTSMI